MTTDTIHTCSYSCERPGCIRAQRDELVAKVEALRAEVAEAREFRDKMANAIGNDQLRRFIEKHGEPVPLTIRMQAAEARAERLAEALKEIRSRSSIDLVMRSDQFELTALLGDIHQIADAALAKENKA